MPIGCSSGIAHGGVKYTEHLGGRVVRGPAAFGVGREPVAQPHGRDRLQPQLLERAVRADAALDGVTEQLGHLRPDQGQQLGFLLGGSTGTVVRSTDVATGRTYNTHIRGKVVGWERISVPAGQFDALRIEREVFAGNVDARRSQEEIHETDDQVQE